MKNMSFISAVKKHIRIEDAIGVGTWFFVFFITLRMMPNADPVIQNNQPFIILGFSVKLKPIKPSADQTTSAT